MSELLLYSSRLQQTYIWKQKSLSLDKSNFLLDFSLAFVRWKVETCDTDTRTHQSDGRLNRNLNLTSLSTFHIGWKVGPKGETKSSDRHHRSCSKVREGRLKPEADKDLGMLIFKVRTVSHGNSNWVELFCIQLSIYLLSTFVTLKIWLSEWGFREGNLLVFNVFFSYVVLQL